MVNSITELFIQIKSIRILRRNLLRTLEYLTHLPPEQRLILIPRLKNKYGTNHIVLNIIEDYISK